MKDQIMQITGSLLIISLGILLLMACTPKVKEQRPNVLFLAVDDLRPELGAYGEKQIKSPNIDRLAASGMVFNKAYCNVPVCGASRASIMTGLRPGYNRFLHYYTQADIETPGIVTLPGHFKKNGYRTVSIGKVFHTPKDNERKAWSEVPYRLDHHLTPNGDWSGSGWQDYLSEANKTIASKKDNGCAWPWENTETEDTAYHDGKYAMKAIQYLNEFKKNKEPFFLALGFLKPHLPFNAPKKYWDMYHRDSISVADNSFFPKDAPGQANFNWGELRQYHGIPKEGPVSDSVAKTLKHGYYACVSYTDALIGQVLAELKRLELDKNTIVVLWGDHGWNLGEHGFWCKHVNFETSLRTTLMVAGPGVSRGSSNSIVELVDLYPTLLDACGLPGPEHDLAGNSMVAVLEDPGAKVKEYGISKYKKGVTLVGDRYFYTEWHDPEKNTVARMLYDHETDPNENENIAELEDNSALVKELSERLNENLDENYWEEGVGDYPNH